MYAWKFTGKLNETNFFRCTNNKINKSGNPCEYENNV